MSCTSNGIISHFKGCPRTVISWPHRRRQAFFTTAKASGRISPSAAASSSLSSIFESRSFQAAVFSRSDSSGNGCRDASISLILATSGRSRRTSRSFFDPIIFLMIKPIMLASKSVGKATGGAAKRQRILRGSGGRRGLAFGGQRRGCSGLDAEAHPEMLRQQSESDDDQLARDEPNEPFECSLRETVGVQADFEHVHTEPRPARHNIADDGAVDEAALADHATPAQMQNQRVPKHDDQRAILLRVPTPEAT